MKPCYGTVKAAASGMPPDHENVRCYISRHFPIRRRVSFMQRSGSHCTVGPPKTASYSSARASRSQLSRHQSLSTSSRHRIDRHRKRKRRHLSPVGLEAPSSRLDRRFARLSRLHRIKELRPDRWWSRDHVRQRDDRTPRSHDWTGVASDRRGRIRFAIAVSNDTARPRTW